LDLSNCQQFSLESPAEWQHVRARAACPAAWSTQAGATGPCHTRRSAKLMRRRLTLPDFRRFSDEVARVRCASTLGLACSAVSVAHSGLRGALFRSTPGERVRHFRANTKYFWTQVNRARGLSGKYMRPLTQTTAFGANSGSYARVASAPRRFAFLQVYILTAASFWKQRRHGSNADRAPVNKRISR